MTRCPRLLSFRVYIFMMSLFHVCCLPLQMAAGESEEGNGDGDQSTDNTLNEKPSDYTATEEKQAELAPNHSLHHAFTEPANATPKPKPVLKSKKQPPAKGTSSPTKPKLSLSSEVNSQ